MFLHKHWIEFLLIASLAVLNVNSTRPQEDQVAKWARKIGDELWKLGDATTKFKEIQARYVHLNAQVELKDLEQLLSEVRVEIERMMDRKCDAIKCISEKAESVSELRTYNDSMYKYYSSKYSNINGTNSSNVELPEILQGNADMYLLMELNNDTHFYNLAVDTSRSSVHVPTNIYDRHPDAAFAIQWSEELDEVFRQNYNSDPALSWQYFASASGVMRHYPAKRWPNIKTDEFDCRVRTWYIEAATCTKDVIILVDNSGSMDGMGRHIASLTVNTILDTFSNNDYINILYYNNETTNYTIPCFKDLLVQATPENILLFKNAIKDFHPSGKTDLPNSLQRAFKILETYREKRGCNKVANDENDGETNKACNQAIMLITDGIIRNLSEIIIKHNHLNGGKDIPVRMFTYLIGKEVTNVDEFRWMSCANRGFYTQVKTLEQVTSAVLQYINVIARPLVLQNDDHPISWTHAYVDMTVNEEHIDDDAISEISSLPRLLTSAAVPAFDKKVNQNNESRTAYLLGVAGTDVPIEDIEKLTLPYKLGVNAYAFIVSNNGYVLMHRDFRPMFEGQLRKNYNSIDLVEVEQFDNDKPPRVLDEKLETLRNSIVNGSESSMLGVAVKYHYDDMRRVTRENYDYYFVPLNQTPFSLAFAVPEGYGHYSLLVADEIKNDRYKPGVKITDYFNGSNWKIHPKWVYCKYHYLEGHEYETPEKELLHFLEKMNEDDFKWEKQYEVGAEEELTKVDCGRKTHGDDDYYCDKHLVQRLVFDAKNTYEAFQGTIWKHDTDQLFRRFNATLRFVATMSGLTRWQYISEEVENNTDKEFGDLHSNAIDETWYKSAVIQHRYDSESFVYSVPFDSGHEEGLLVTGSFAVFPSDRGDSAPGCVVGFQFAHKNFMEIVHNLTSKLSIECTDCGTCNHNMTCYIIDNDGYVIVSEDVHDTGKFFGELEGDIMGAMLEKNIFEKVRIYDYQAVCNTKDDHTSDASYLSTPTELVKYFINWFVFQISWFAVQLNFYDIILPLQTHASEAATDKVDHYFYDCEKERDLFMLNQKLFTHRLSGEFWGARNYYLKKIEHSNLLFVAINDTVPKPHDTKPILTTPRKIIYEDSADYACKKLELNNLPRRRLAGCYNEHPLESEIKMCGSVAKTGPTCALVLLFLLFVIID